MKRKLMKSVILSLSLMLLCMNLDTSYIRAVNADPETTVTVKNHGVNNVKETPSALNDGQVWTNKEVVDLGDGTFEITLTAWAKAFKDADVDKNALKEGTTLNFTDVIGNGFSIDGELPANMKQENNVITWELASDQFTSNQGDSAKVSVSFKVKYTATETGTYYTNEKAEATFTPNEGNPFYYDVTEATETTEKVIAAKSDMNWDINTIKSDEETTGWIELEVVEKEVEKVEQTTEEDNTETKETSDFDEEPFDPATVVPFTKAGPLLQNIKNYSYRSAKNNTTTDLVKNDGIETSKTATFDENSNSAKISLEAFTTGNVQYVGKPVDIVLVLDQSGSMESSIDDKPNYIEIYELDKTKSYFVKDSRNDTYYEVRYKDGKWYNGGIEVKPKESANDNAWDHRQFFQRNAKLDALQESASNFINQVNENAKINNVDHRIAIVGFASGSGYNYTNTGILSLDNPSYYNYIKEEDYLNALKKCQSENDQAILNKAIKNLSANGATQIDLGMEMAYKIMDKSGSYSERNKVVVVFTDGVPTTFNQYSSSVADGALSWGHKIKNNGATVYTIGVVNGADPSADIYNNVNGDDKKVINKFLHLLSSNYIGDYTMDSKLFENTPWWNNGSGKPNDKGYYLAANDTETLKEIFDSIYSQIQPNIELGPNTQLIDRISDYFETPIDAGDVKVFTQSYKGGDYASVESWDDKVDITNKVKVKIEGDKIIVTGFDYNSNLVLNDNDTPSGTKLVVEISNVRPIDGFIGGNSVPTNKRDSGIYSEGKVVENFEQPNVDIPIKYEFKVKDNSIYIGDDWKNFEKFLMNDENKLMYSLTTGGKEYALGDLKNDFVEIVYEIKDGDTVVATYTVGSSSNDGTLEFKDSSYSTVDLSTTNEYEIEVKVTPKYNGAQNEITKNKKADLYVFTPKISVSDDIIFYGDLTDITERYDENSVNWSCKQNSSAPSPETDKPELDITAQYVKDESNVGSSQVELSEDTQFKISNIKRKDTDKDIINDSIVENNSEKNDKDEKHDFTIYVLKGQLNINKKIDEQYTDTENHIKANQTFVYLIERRNEKNGEVVDRFYQTIDFSANESTIEKIAKIKGLKKGYYDVTELTEWSWKYKLQSSGDDYSKNSENTTERIYIGDDSENKDKLYYGVEENTVKQSIDYSNPSNTYFVNHLNTAFSKMFGDVASAINKFISSK